MLFFRGDNRCVSLGTTDPAFRFRSRDEAILASIAGICIRKSTDTRKTGLIAHE